MKMQRMESEVKLNKTEMLDFFRSVHMQMTTYSFHNDHIVRGPLCRAVGLTHLLTREKVSGDLKELLDMLMVEVRQLEEATITISRNMGVYEDNMQRLIKVLESKQNV